MRQRFFFHLVVTLLIGAHITLIVELVFRRGIWESIQRLGSDLQKTLQLRGRERLPLFDAYVRNAQQVCLVGISLAGVVTHFQAFILERAKAGCVFRFITVSPHFFDIREKSKAWQGYPLVKQDLEHTIRTLENLMRETSNVKLRHLLLPPTYSLLMVDPEEPDGEIQVELYSYVELWSHEPLAYKRPHFTLTQGVDKRWYSFFQKEFDLAWKMARPHELKGSTDNHESLQEVEVA